MLEEQQQAGGAQQVGQAEIDIKRRLLPVAIRVAS